MQAHYDPTPTPPPFSTPAVVSPANPCVWPNKNSSTEHYANPVLYNRGGLHNHPNVVEGLASRTIEAREKKCSGEDWDSIRKCSESKGEGFICGRSGESGKKAWNSQTDDASQSRTAGILDKSDDKANQGNERVSECQLRQERRKLLNREAARRSRIRKKQEQEELQAKVKELQRETSILASTLKRHSEDCQKLKKKNGFLLAELRQKCSQDVISYLEAQDPECILHSIDHGDNSHNQESSSEGNSSSHQNSDASNSNWMDQADSD